MRSHLETEPILGLERALRSVTAAGVPASLPVGAVVVVDRDGFVRYSTPDAVSLFGAGGAVGSLLGTAIHPHDRDRLRVALQEAAGTVAGTALDVELRTGTDSGWQALDCSISNHLDDQGVEGLVVTAHDVTRRWRADHLLAGQNEVLEMIAGGAALGESLAAVAALCERLLPGASCDVCQLDDDSPDEGGGAAGSDPGWRGVARDGRPVIVADIDCDQRLGPWRDMARGLGVRSVWSLPIVADPGSKVLGTLDVTWRHVREPSADDWEPLRSCARLAAIAANLERVMSRLAHETFHDALTGLPNRVLLLDRLGQTLGRDRRIAAATGVVFLDLDNFKLINDSLGHAAGNALLVALARRLGGAVRPGDTLARLSGDEFVVLCEDLAAPEEAIAVAERLLDLLRAPVDLDGRSVTVTGSAGVAIGGDSSTSPEILLRDADAAMYRAKERGRNCVEMFDEELLARAIRRMELEQDLRQALARNELFVVYQPLVSPRSGQMVGIETLLRWRHPERGVVLPTAFVPLAEDTGLILPIGAWVLAAACRQAAWWARHGRDDLVVSVNLSARQLNQPELPAIVKSALGGSGLASSRLVLEITESALMAEGDTPGANMAALSAMGVRLAVDDFGTGYSSLLSLRRFPVSELKIDARFIRGLGESQEDDVIVEAIVRLGAALDLTVVAEGVESRSQLDRLVALGCPVAQGFYFSPPLDPQDVPLSDPAYCPWESP